MGFGKEESPVEERHWVAETIELEVSEYERVRSNATWFVIKQDHDMRQIERVISRHDGYAVVEKLIGVEYLEVTHPRFGEAHP